MTQLKPYLKMQFALNNSDVEGYDSSEERKVILKSLKDNFERTYPNVNYEIKETKLGNTASEIYDGHKTYSYKDDPINFPKWIMKFEAIAV
jgi:hypothetical protein